MRCRWTNEEVDKVVTRAVALRRADSTLAQCDAIYRAQGQVVAQDRRKPELTSFFRRSLLRRITAAEANPDFQAALPAELAVPAPEPTPSEPPLFAMLREFGTALGASLAKELAPMIAGPIRDAISAAKANGNGANGHAYSAGQEHSIAIPAHRAAERLELNANGSTSKLPEKFVTHKVAVVGLKNDQRQEIKKRFPHIDFRWLDNDANGSTIGNVTRQCECSFTMVKFIRHVSDRAVIGQRVRINGGVSELARIISARFPPSTSMEPAVAH